MSRKHTIIIAVLLNAGLLIVLFATSLKPDKKEEGPPATVILASNQPEVKEAASPPAPIASPMISQNQVDQVIEQYVTPQVITSSDQSPNFLADLQAIGTPSVPSPMEESQVVESKLKEVTVKKGDVLERIARQNHVTVTDIMKANKLATTRLKIGQVLKIPAAASISTSSSTGSQYYTVKAGDNPWTIAVKHRMKVEELLKLNNLDEQKAKRLKAGDQIRIK